jgi:hypothetical protein
MSARGGAVTKQQLAARSADGVAAFDARPHHFVTTSLRHFTASIALLAACASAHALTIERSQASYENKHFNFELTALVDAPVAQVQKVLRDYEGYRKLDSRILEARVVERPTDYSCVLETTLRVCMGPFCRNVKRVEYVQESPLELVATADPSRSDVKFGETHMMLSVADGRTRISYRTSIVPDFWIPAIVGRRWLLKTLEDATTDLFRSIEAEAKAEATPKSVNGQEVTSDR